MRLWLALLLVVAAPAAQASCSWSPHMEGRWGLWDTRTGEVQTIEAPVFDNGAGCEPAPPGHALDGDMFVWASPWEVDDDRTTVHVWRQGVELARWPVPHRPRLDVRHIGVHDGVAYLVWEAPPDNTSAGPLGRLVLATGAYTEIPNPYPRTDPDRMRLTGSVLWTDARRADGVEAVWAHDVGSGRRLLNGTSAQDLGHPPGIDAYPLWQALGHGWAVFAVGNGTAQPYWAHHAATGREAGFTLAEWPWDAYAAGDRIYAIVNGTLLKVDVTTDPATVTSLELPGLTERGLHDGHVVGAAGDVVVLAYFVDTSPPPTPPQASSSPTLLLPLLAILALAGRRQRGFAAEGA